MTASKEKIKQWYAKAEMPSGLSITPRRLNLNLDDSVATHWSYDNALLTAFNTAFSATFPLGERFMIDCVRENRPLVKEHKELFKQCGGFIGQEAHHANEHETLNNFMISRGFPVDRLEARIKWWTDLSSNRFSKRFQMAISAAAEHLTAMYGNMVLSNPEVIANTDKGVQPIMVWHAIEEIEHKAVTHDLYEAVDGSYFLRCAAYVWCLSISTLFVVSGTRMMLKADKSKRTYKDTLKGLKWMFGFGEHAGYLRKSGWELLSYFNPSYHPWKQDNSNLLHKFMPTLTQMLDDLAETKSAKESVASADTASVA